MNFFLSTNTLVTVDIIMFFKNSLSFNNQKRKITVLFKMSKVTTNSLSGLQKHMPDLSSSCQTEMKSDSITERMLCFSAAAMVWMRLAPVS